MFQLIQINKNMSHLQKISIKPLCIFLTLVSYGMVLNSCKKEETAGKNANSNKISAIVADNFNLSVYNTALIRTGLAKTTDKEGLFTAIAPSDDAFRNAGFGNATAILSADPSRVATIMNYHILNGVYEFNKLPFLFNQEVRSANGGKLFVTHWVKRGDTILTINGSKVVSQNVKASNGLIQVIDRVLEPYTHNLVVEAIASDRDLSLFYQALQRSDLVETLNGKGPYTVFAPNNAAMVAFGLRTIEDINAMDPAVLQRLVRYHISSDRRFVYDYVLSTGSANRSDQTMLDGNSIQVILKPNPQVAGAFIGIELKGTGNTSVIQLSKQDVLTGNGVVHTIGGLLKITQ
ncbi:fasciclin domain-containing protein [Pedobacter nyackensis]|uniref:Uncaracterized surface protein containing fasciclin (FAS1) repeats n=1 Tax=Pedobacter nyackensis TaxID=475255 RepID=A0A1W2CZ58_9SPHI|nr:fasciclin domain-containing protein [Pedobacter nyackensis]SMC90008.1 Uncaracterized surface protein containing fasciclin (FAS1) repeats [Pedobacter nyackensis]